MKPWKEVIDGIRNAVLGKEVREDIAQMGEYVEQFANTAGENIQKAIDYTLSLSGKAADAKATGDAVGELKEDLVKQSLFEKKTNSALETYKENIDYTLLNDYIDTQNGSIYSDSNGRHAEFDITEDMVACIITGLSFYPPQLGLFCFTDGTNVLSSYYYPDVTDKSISDYYAIVPDGAIKLYVNASVYKQEIKVVAIKKFDNKKKYHVYSSCQGFKQGAYDLDGNYKEFSSSEEDYNQYSCSRKNIFVGFTDKLYFRANSDYGYNISLFSYNDALCTSKIKMINPNIKSSNDWVGVDVHGYNYVRATIYQPQSHDISNANFEIMCDIDNVISYKNPIPMSNLLAHNGSYITIAQSGGDYSNLYQAYSNGGANAFYKVKNGTYDDRIDVTDIYIDGESEDTTKIIYNNAEYPYCPIYPRGNVSMSNLTLESVNNPSANPTYALHFDNDSDANSIKVFKNCTFISDKEAGVGIGLRKGEYVLFENCTFITNSDENYSSSTNAGLFMHDSDSPSYYGEQFIVFKSCKFLSKNNKALTMGGINEENEMIVAFIDCTFFSETYGTNNVIMFNEGHKDGMLCGQSIKLSALSHGNNIGCLNAF